jgi:hypothetical protein
MAQHMTPDAIAAVVALLPQQWLVGDSTGAPPRDASVYTRYLMGRLEARPAFLEEALRARSLHV